MSLDSYELMRKRLELHDEPVAIIKTYHATSGTERDSHEHVIIPVSVLETLQQKILELEADIYDLRHSHHYIVRHLRDQK